METKWLNPGFDYEQFLFAGDIGGTNTNLALVGRKGEKYTLILECIYKSGEIDGIVDPVLNTIGIARGKKPDLKIDVCCISAAGPVSDNKCSMTNCRWSIDGSEIEKAAGLKTVLINDFLAIGYGIPTLDTSNPLQITQFPCVDGTKPQPRGTTKAVVGAGTGLGMGFLTAVNGVYTAYPSEGGHSAYFAFDADSAELKAYLTEIYGQLPGMETVVSGKGIVNIFKFFRERRGIKLEGLLKEIDEADDERKPALISRNAGTNEICREMMALFIKSYAMLASNIAAIFLPFSGLYLGGGGIIKDEPHFLKDNLFMRYFEMNYNRNIKPLLKKIPVYVIKDYSISLYGAANAGHILLNRN
ncbi:MAG: glucokinase [Spirochaetales bacterium]|nr:glucokinase [Spirochaetales bacterium]